MMKCRTPGEQCTDHIHDDTLSNMHILSELFRTQSNS